MKDFLTLAVTAFIIWWVTSMIDNSYGAEKVVDEMIMETQVGEIVLTVNSCSPELKAKGFDWYGYAEDKKDKILHPGCWSTEQDKVLIYFPEIDQTAVYFKYQFHPRLIIKPTL
jgi:hypothetical protein